MQIADSERRLLTILFADLSGFTALSSTLEPEEVSDVASTSFELLNRPIIANGGTVHKYEGDLVIALFGYPNAHEDDPERAIKASLEMMALIPRVNEKLTKKLKTKTKTDLGLHIGINSGTVFVGEIGSSQKKEYTVMGDAVNLASRLKDIARREEILVSTPVFRSTRYLFDYEAMPQAELKGISEPVSIFKVLAVKEKPEPKRGIAGLHSPMVGRSAELELLVEAVKKLHKNQGGVFFILGDAGLGKSRLLVELKEVIASKRLPINSLEGQCFSYSENIPYLPFLQILEKLFGITEDDSLKTFKDKVIDRTKEICPDEWEEIVPYIGYLFSLRFADEFEMKTKYLDAQGLKTQIMASIRKLLYALARAKPILLILEDYHWIDKESQELLESIFSISEETRILLLAISRIEKDKVCFKTKERLKSFLGLRYKEVMLKPLEVSDATELVYNLLKIPGITEGFKDKILAQAEGNPFYAEEIIRSLIDSGVLVYEDGVWKLTTHVSTIKIPDSVQAIIAARIDHLEQETKNILQVASVIGRSFYERILERLCEIDNLMLVLHLATLEDFDYITKSKEKKEAEYAFRHPIIPEVIYNGLVKKKRKELHRKTGEIIEELYPERLDELTEVLAYQYSNSDNMSKALEWTQRAGQKAKARYANDEALQYYQNVISIVREELAGDRNDLLSACEAVGDIYLLMGEPSQAMKYYEMMFADAGMDKIVRCRARKKIGDVYESQGKYDEALKMLSEAQMLVQGGSVEEMVESARIAFVRCGIYREKGMIKEAIENGETGLKTIEEITRRAASKSVDKKTLLELKGHGLHNMGAIYIYKGDYDKAIELNENAIVISDELGDKARRCRQLTNLGIIYLYKGEFNKAIELWQQSLEQAEAIGDKGHIVNIIGNMGIAYHDLGENEKALELYMKSKKIAEEIGDKRPVSAAYINMGSIHSSRGDYSKAIESYEKAVTLKEEIGDRHGYAIATGNLGTMYESGGEFGKALNHYERAVKIFEEIGDRRYISAGFCMMAEVYRSIGNYDRAREYAQKAIEIFNNIGDKHGIGMAHCCLAGILLDTGVLDEAEEHLSEAEKFLSAVKEKSMSIELHFYSALLNIARLQQTGEATLPKDQQEVLIEQTHKHAEKALAYSKEMGAVYQEAKSYFIYGKIYAVLDDYKKAEEYLKKTIAICEAIKEKKLFPDAVFEYAKLLKKGTTAGIYSAGAADGYFASALETYKQQNLRHKQKQVEQSQKK